MPWQTLLLFGPAGSGKRFLAQAFCSELSSTFISLETSLIPKDLKNEKILKNLFEIAIKNRPAVVFIDEIHLLINEENENSRILPEFLDQLEKSGNFQDLVVFCSTTKPWRLDPDVCRRVERKIYVPLPDWERRKEVIREGLGRKCPDFVVEQLADLTSGFSAEDLRKLGRVLQEKERISEEFKEECKDNGKTSDVKIFREGQVEESGGKHQDFYQAVSMVKPSVSLNTLIRYQYFAESYFETFNINPC
jgi:SpoVK/Ycf46/Vps4 family AAA+-type ATPase